MAAYDRDLDTRRAALDQQAEDLDAKIKGFKAQIADLEDRSRTAASRGDLDTATDLDEQAEQLRKQLSIANRKRRIASSTELKGGPTIYKSVAEAERAYLEAEKIGHEYIREARAVVAQWLEFFEELSKKSKFAGRYGPNMDARRYERIDHHFNAEFYARVAEKQKADEQERKEAWEAEKARRRATGKFFCS